MHTEHHIDSFDLESFFKLHDLDMDGYWDKAEIEAVYGLHHHSVKERIPAKAQVDGRAGVVVEKVLEKLDKDDDKRVSLEEFLTGGNEGLPSFEGYKDLGRESCECLCGSSSCQITMMKSQNSEFNVSASMKSSSNLSG